MQGVVKSQPVTAHGRYPEYTRERLIELMQRGKPDFVQVNYSLADRGANSACFRQPDQPDSGSRKGGAT